MNDGGFGPWVEGLIMAEEHDRRMPRPCPFCGNEEVETMDITDTASIVYCPKCYAAGPEGTSEEEAIEKWNRRVKE